MTKTKRILTILLMAILSVMVALTFTACGGDDNDDNGGSTANTKVTEAQFNSAANAATYTAFKVEIETVSKANGVVIPDESAEMTYIYTANGIYMDVPGQEAYYQKTSDGYFAYVKNGEEWEKIATQQSMYDMVASQILETSSPVSLISGYQISYASLTYSDAEKCYVYNPGSANGISAITKLFFSDGKIVKVSVSASNSNIQEEFSTTLVYSYNQTINFPSVGGDNSGDNSGDTPATPGETVYTVTDAQFATAISPATYTAFKVSGSNTLKVNGVVDPEQSTNLTYVVSEEGMYIEVDGNESYFEVGDGAYYMYGKSGDEWMKISAPENAYQQAVSQILSNASPASYFVMFELTDLSMLNYSDTEKCYVFSPEGEEGITSTMKFFFENGKIVKVEMIAFNAELQEEITSIMNYSYAAADLTIQFPNASTGGNSGVSPEPQDCQLIPTEFFDENGVFPKSYRCTCGDASHNVTNSCIKITSAEEFIALVSMLNHEANIGTLTIEIQNDIDLGGATIPALKAYDYQYRGRVFTLAGVDGGVTISNFTVVADQDYLAAGLFGCVTGDLTIKNITLSNMTINENEDVAAGAFVGIYMPAGDEETASGLRIENCSVVNSSITAGCVGGIYGLAISELSDERLINVKGVKVQNCTLNGSVVGGLMGIGAECNEREMIVVVMNDFTLLGNSITATNVNEAGLYIGLFGNARIDYEYPSTGNEDKINENTVIAAEIENTTRDYGRTGWQSKTDETHVWVGTSPMTSFEHGVH
ncbi:MAG: hypothetical protein IKB98_01335 [Clostridia bacterium]|nr:hypothetical protein [Clostridia bacterium]